MRRRISMALVLMVAGAQAQDVVPFQAPRSYEANRYEADWSKNPFTLKTAPVVTEQASFAKDLAIGSYYGDAENPTVVVVNIKTGDRTRLQKGRPASNGMTLKSFNHGSGRKDAVAEVTLGAETSELRYNSDYVKQLASTEGARAPQPGQNPQAHQQQIGVAAGAGRGVVPQGQGGRPPSVPGAVNTVGQVPMPVMPQAVPGGGLGAPGAMAASSVQRPSGVTVATSGNGVTLNVPAGGQTGSTLVSQNASSPSAETSAPLPIRRRLIPPANGTAP